MSRCEGETDIAIVGAGIAGSALAAALADSAWQVTLIDAKPRATEWPQAGADSCCDFDPRVSALGLAAKAFLERCDAWPGSHGQRVAPFHAMEVWDGASAGRMRFGESGARGEEAIGYLVENRLITTALLRTAARAPNVRFAQDSIEAIEAGRGSCELRSASGRQLSASLAVAADGAISPLRKMAGFRTGQWDCRQIAIVATVRTARPHQNTAWQRFAPSGPLAFLPLAGGDGHFSSIVWSIDTAEGERTLALADEAFCQRLGEAFEHRLGEVLACGPRLHFPLWQRHALRYARGRVALLGDAAHTIHPLAGQGINLGLLDARALAAELSAGDIDRALSRYAWRRAPHNWLFTGSMEGFKRLFANTSPALQTLRDHGMRAIDRTPLIKRSLTAFATRAKLF